MSSKGKLKIFSIVSIIILCIGLTFRGLQNDTFYIIKLGELISKNGVDLLDHYCWITNLNYTYPHWLYDLIIYYVYDWFSYDGVYISVIVCFILLILCIYFVNLKLTKNGFASFLVAVIAVFRLSMFAVARSQIISLPLFILEVYCINKLIESGKNKYIVYLCIMSLIIANTHATTWLFYFILFLPFIGEGLVYKIINNQKVRKIYKLDNFKDFKIIVENIDNIKKVLVGLVLSFFMGIFSPSRVCYTYVFKVMMGNSQNVLLEHLPLTVIENPFFICLFGVIIIVLAFTGTKLYLREVFMIGGLALMCLMSTRHLAFFYTIGFIYIVVISVRYLNDVGDKTLDILERIIVNNKVVTYLLLVVIFVVSGFNFYKHSQEEYVSYEDYPVKAVNYIKKNLDYKSMKLYNNYDYGSYLLFNDIPVFIDSRCDLYLKEFNGMDYSIFDELEDINFDYVKRFEYFGVTHVLLDKNSSLYMILLNDVNYGSLYEDDDFILFEKLL